MTRKVKVLKIILVVICSLILFVGCNDKNEEIDNDIINDETEVKEIILNKKSINIKVGQKNTIKAVIKPENATDKKII